MWSYINRDLELEILSQLPFNPIFLLKMDNALSELTVRASNGIRNKFISYLGDLVQQTEEELLRVPYFGRKSLNDIKENLTLFGQQHFGMKLTLGMTLPDWPPENIKNLVQIDPDIIRHAAVVWSPPVLATRVSLEVEPHIVADFSVAAERLLTAYHDLLCSDDPAKAIKGMLVRKIALINPQQEDQKENFGFSDIAHSLGLERERAANVLGEAFADLMRAAQIQVTGSRVVRALRFFEATLEGGLVMESIEGGKSVEKNAAIGQRFDPPRPVEFVQNMRQRLFDNMGLLLQDKPPALAG